jgi:hypothetical protein
MIQPKAFMDYLVQGIMVELDFYKKLSLFCPLFGL